MENQFDHGSFKKIIDLEHREERSKVLKEEREESDKLYAKKDYEKAVRWAIVFIASGIFIALVNAVTGGIISNILGK